MAEQGVEFPLKGDTLFKAYKALGKNEVKI
jgi:hypothetical protein